MQTDILRQASQYQGFFQYGASVVMGGLAIYYFRECAMLIHESDTLPTREEIMHVENATERIEIRDKLQDDLLWKSFGRGLSGVVASIVAVPPIAWDIMFKGRPKHRFIAERARFFLGIYVGIDFYVAARAKRNLALKAKHIEMQIADEAEFEQLKRDAKRRRANKISDQTENENVK
mmetsp:Transcript_28299/g.31442  ORF Transcript_28299/g.31442 Transcript_28299/m.31442 type:complete len:177 (+) Transcript_28299:72-602(+)